MSSATPCAWLGLSSRVIQGPRSCRKETMTVPLLLSPHAKQIAEGLVRTGRASDARLFRTWLQLRATAGNFYWIALDG
jgi:hypothetical protein